jgi:hypothetical protein
MIDIQAYVNFPCEEGKKKAQFHFGQEIREEVIRESKGVETMVSKPKTVG